ncbi:hypothetical protein D3C75_671740 [compost metagenome]
MKRLSLLMAAVMRAGLVRTRPSERVTEVRMPFCPGVMAVTWMVAGRVWLMTTLFRVWPSAGMAVRTRVWLKLGPVAVSPSGMSRLCSKRMTVGLTTKLCKSPSTRLGSSRGLLRASLPYWKPLRMPMVRSGDAAE